MKAKIEKFRDMLQERLDALEERDNPSERAEEQMSALGDLIDACESAIEAFDK